MSVDWFPVVFITFKVAVLGIGMFFAIKWHYDQDKKAKAAKMAKAAHTSLGSGAAKP